MRIDRLGADDVVVMKAAGQLFGEVATRAIEARRQETIIVENGGLLGTREAVFHFDISVDGDR